MIGISLVTGKWTWLKIGFWQSFLAQICYCFREIFKRQRKNDKTSTSDQINKTSLPKP